jgi:hypothetical protein
VRPTRQAGTGATIVNEDGATSANALLPQDAATWAAWVTRTFLLTPTELMTLKLAERALRTALDPATDSAAASTAMQKFLTLSQRLDLPEAIDGEEVAQPVPRGA